MNNNNNKKRCNASIYVRRPNMEAKNTLENTARPPMKKSKVINYLDVNQMSNIYKLKHKLCPDITHNHIMKGL